jgi:hypothetical protein
MDRKRILELAEQCICRDREYEYGKPESNLALIADFWNDYIGNRMEGKFDAEDVAIMMALLKIARITTGTFKADSYIDAVGYLALAGELTSGGK